jgi:uncharacterized repeat protein (TIGR01451 family)
MSNALKRLAFAGLFLLPFIAAPLHAQTPTPEGTVIKNKATATYTDGNNNTYSSVSDSVNVTVGFLAGPNPSAAASVTPASPSTADTIAVTLTNSGNGTDTMSVNVTVAAGLTATGYRFNGTTYATLVTLNAGLATYSFGAGGTGVVQVIYNVATGQGGATLPVVLTQTSKRTPASSAAVTTNVLPPGARAVAVSPQLGTITKLPSNGTLYSQTFVVTNNGNATDTYSLVAAIAAAPSGAVSISTVNGVAGTTGSITVNAGVSTNVIVEYTVSAAVAAGTTDKITFTATSNSDATVKDVGDLTVTVSKAAVALAKTAWNDAQSVLLTAASTVKPGDYYQYKIIVSNGASAASAASVQISDPMPAQVTYVSASADGAGWTINYSGGTVTATLTGTLAAGASRFIWVRVRVN